LRGLHDVLRLADCASFTVVAELLPALARPEHDDVGHQRGRGWAREDPARIDDFKGLSRFGTWAYTFGDLGGW
jgi:hypothetical protein